MDIVRAIRVFRTVVEQQSFSAAARELGQVNSAVSRQVSELEQHLGCKLLNRTTRSMSLTEEGHHYLDHFEGILNQVDELHHQVEHRRQQIGGLLRITAPLHIGHSGLQHLISGFLHRYPEVRFSWLIVNRYVDLIEEGCDLAIRAGEIPDSTLVARELDRMAVHFVASPEYLASAGTPAAPDQLNSHRCIVDGSIRSPSRWIYRSRSRGIRHISVPATISVNNGELAAQFAAEGLGIAYLPDFLISDQLRDGRLTRILTSFEIDPVPVSLVWPANRMMRPALRALIDYLLEHYPESRQPGP